MVRRANFHEHPDDDSEEARQLWHTVLYIVVRSSCLANATNEPRAEAT